MKKFAALGIGSSAFLLTTNTITTLVQTNQITGPVLATTLLGAAAPIGFSICMWVASYKSVLMFLEAHHKTNPLNLLQDRLERYDYCIKEVKKIALEMSSLAKELHTLNAKRDPSQLYQDRYSENKKEIRSKKIHNEMAKLRKKRKHYEKSLNTFNKQIQALYYKCRTDTSLMTSKNYDSKIEDIHKQIKTVESLDANKIASLTKTGNHNLDKLADFQ